MADFRFYLNRQGLRGLTGKKGDQGFSPIIDVVEDTIESYKLRITTENNEIETPNLKGSLSIQDQGGTYVRYDRETGELTANEADRATKETYGIVKLAKSEDLDNLELQDTVAITPETLREGLGVNLISPDNSIQIVLNPDTQKTELRAVTGGIEVEIAQERSERIAADNTERSERIAADSSIRQSISTLSHSLQTTDNRVTDVTSDLATEKSERIAADSAIRQSVSTLSNSLQTTNSRVQAVTTDLATERQVRLAADTQQQQLIDAERQERETQDAALQSQLGSKLTVDNIKAGNNVTITKEGNNVTINSTGGGVVPENIMTLDTNQEVTGEKIFKDNNLQIGNNSGYKTLATFEDNEHYLNPEHTASFNDATRLNGKVIGNEIYVEHVTFVGDDVETTYSPVLSQEDVDNQTIKVVDGVLHADFSEIGDEVNSLAGRMNTAESAIEVLETDMTSVTGDVEELQSKVRDLELFKFPNVTIIGEPTINNGQISNFSMNNYLQFPFEFETKGRTWLLNGSFDTRSDITIQQNIIDSLASVALAVRNGRLVLALSTNGTSFDLGEHSSEDYDVYVNPNTKYYFRLQFNGYTYTLLISTDKQSWITAIDVFSDQPIASTVMTISSAGHPFGGIINLNDWNLTVGDVLVWQGMDDVGIASRMDVNASNITETGKETIKEIAGIGEINEALDLLNGGETTLLSTKANVSFSNINDDAKQVIRDAVVNDSATKSLIAGLGLPSQKYDNLTLGSSGTFYTAPANGWFYLRKATGSSSWQWCNVWNRTNDLLMGGSFSQSNVGIITLIPVLKGDRVEIVYTLSGNTEAFRFYYAEGEQE